MRGLRHYRQRIFGVGFILLVAALVATAIADYIGVFRDGVPVTLKVTTSGNQLGPGTEVRFHGYELGTVTEVSAEDGGVSIQLRLKPRARELVPANVHARILPKTLIGQNYIDLVLPENPAREPVAAGDVITKDRSATAVKLESALNNLLDVLHAVPPQQVSSTLNAVAGALRGRGKQLGDTLSALEDYVAGLNPAVPDLRADIRALAEFGETYSTAAPDLLGALDNLTTTAKTVARRSADLRTLYSTLTATVRQADDFLSANGQNIIDLAAASRPTLELLARYAPEYPCLLRQLADLVPKINEAFGAGTPRPALRVTLEVTNSRGRYKPGVDAPVYADNRGPRCYPVRQTAPQYPKGGPLRDGAEHPPAPDTGNAGGGSLTLLTPAPSGADMGLPNSERERRFISGLLAEKSKQGAQPAPAWSSLLVGPLLRGSEVTPR